VITPVRFPPRRCRNDQPTIATTDPSACCLAADRTRWTWRGNPQHPGDIDAQLELALDNLEAVLATADMTFENVVRLNFFTTDVDELLKQFGTVNNRFEDHRYATSVLGVAQLPAQFLVMVEATAVD
jgi:enamine deaminase RidA (YjgF/YER057c/UK114 family)